MSTPGAKFLAQERQQQAPKREALYQPSKSESLRAPLISFLDARSLEAIARMTGESVQKFIERYSA